MRQKLSARFAQLIVSCGFAVTLLACASQKLGGVKDVILLCEKDTDACSSAVLKVRREKPSDARAALKELCDAKIHYACGHLSYGLRVRYLDFWKQFFSNEGQPAWKIGKVAPKELIELLSLENKALKIPLEPSSVVLKPNDLRQFETVIKRLKGDLNRFINDRIIAIFAVRNLGSSAKVVAILDPTTPKTHYILTIDIDRASLPANSWASAREATAFGAEKNIQLKIENAQNNNTEATLEYLLLHELGHVIAHQKRQIPLVPEYAHLPEDDSNSEYLKTFWYNENFYSTENQLFDFYGRNEVRYYRTDTSKLTNRQIQETFIGLSRSGYPTMYSATQPAEDFADSFAAYYHSVVLGKPYTFYLNLVGEAKLEVKSCWNEARCEKRRKYFDRLLKDIQGFKPIKLKKSNSSVSRN